METNVQCPKCDHLFNVENAVEKSLREEIEAESKSILNKELEEISKKKNQLDKAQKSFDEQLSIALKEKETNLRSSIKKELESESDESIKELQKQLAEQTSANSSMKKEKLAFQQKSMELEQKVKDIDLEVQEKVLQKSEEIKQQALNEERAKRDLADKQKEMQLQTLKNQIEDLKRKAEQGSQQSQGEVLELELEELLRTTFPYDTISEVAKGTSGADCVQEVVNSHLKVAGAIAYETKRTKSFSNGWIDKLKSDMRIHKAHIGVLVTETMPKDMDSFGEIDGIWVCKFSEVEALSRVLRHGLLQVAQVQIASENSDEKMKLLYDYLISSDFKQQMDAVVNGYTNMKMGIDKEKRAMKKIWTQREKELELVIDGAVGMYGSIKAIAGNSVAQIEGLELDDNLIEE